MKKTCLILLIALLSLSVYASDTPSDEDIQSSAKALGVPYEDLLQFVKLYHMQSVIPEPDFVFSTDQEIYDFHEENWNSNSAFFEKYKDACIELKDVIFYGVEEVYDVKLHSMAYEIKLEMQNHGGLIFGILQASETAKLTNLKKDSRITVRGFVREERSLIELRDAVILL